METTTKKGPEAIGEEALLAYVTGERTWAEVAGLSAEQAHAIARLGLRLAEGARLAEAAVVFDGLLAYNPRDAFAQTVRAGLHERQGDDARAIAHYCAALAIEPAYAPALLGRAEILLRLGDVEAARGDLTAVGHAAGNDAFARRASALLAATAARAAGETL